MPNSNDLVARILGPASRRYIEEWVQVQVGPERVRPARGSVANTSIGYMDRSIARPGAG